MSPKRVTILDIAREAGVSRQTVSRVLNNMPDVKPETREKVQSLMDSMNYSPDPLARGLVQKRNYVIGILTESLSGTTTGRILEGAESCAREHGFHTIISGVQTGEKGEPIFSELLKQQRLEGILINYHGSETDEFKILDQISPEIPVVTLGYAPDNPRVLPINIDNYEGGRIAADYLLTKGYRNIACVTGPAHYYEVINRTNGFMSEFQRRSLEFQKHRLIEGHWTVDSGTEAVQKIFDSGINTDAIWSQNDEMAIGIIHGIKKRGLRVPEDIAVLGFDDLSWGRYLEPALSTIHRPSMTLGNYSVLRLLNEIRSQHGEELLSMQEGNEFLLPRLVLRQSC